MNFPDNLRYTKDHEWVRVESDDLWVIGITDFAQRELGDIVYVEIETVGETLEQGKVFGTVEAVKTVSELFMPVSGTVESINENLEDAPESLNASPYEEGWLVKIKPSNPEHLEELLDVAAYKEHIGQEEEEE